MFQDSFLGHLPKCLIVQVWIISIILVVFLLVSFGHFPGSLVALKSGQRQGNGLAVKVIFGSPVSYVPASG